MRRREFVGLLGGATAAWPFSVRAQQKTLPVIGFLSSRSPEDSQSVLAGFRKGLSESGILEGKDVLIEYRWARGDFGRLPALAAEFARDRVTVIVAAGGEPPALAAKAATSTIPIVFVSGDPIKGGLVASLNRPGGNATGVYNLVNELEAKQLGLLHELFPGATLFGVLLNPNWRLAQSEVSNRTGG
jgi:putative ABC transport system substrate-binding protein